MKAQILGMGHAYPEKILNNEELETMVDTKHEWIVERTGIHERRIADLNTASSDLSFIAAEMALKRAGITADQLDLIIVGTSTPDMLLPSTACTIQDRLGAVKAGAFDLEAGCTGFVYSLTVAEMFLLSPSYHYILVVGVDVCSRFTDYTDRNTCVIFGDGAGAAVLGKGNSGPGIIGSYLG
ncbi:MAG: 3-oxoacyl-ACP synthase, partial [Syntrophomonadaceae bacterium]|nr:3-oxoacyl-ACP synthase [Syntrophomonadaceae bacterium]